MAAIYLPKSDEAEVLREQFAVLLDHYAASHEGHSDCSECWRFLALRGLLLEPFKSRARSTAASSVR